MCSFWLCESIVANPIIYRLIPSPSRFEIRQWVSLADLTFGYNQHHCPETHAWIVLYFQPIRFVRFDGKSVRGCDSRTNQKETENGAEIVTAVGWSWLTFNSWCKLEWSLPLRMALYVILKNLVVNDHVFLLGIGSLFIRHSLANAVDYKIYSSQAGSRVCLFTCLSHLPFFSKRESHSSSVTMPFCSGETIEQNTMRNIPLQEILGPLLPIPELWHCYPQSFEVNYQTRETVFHRDIETPRR